MTHTPNPFAGLRAVAFDCFGTLLEIRRPANPWRRILAAAGPPGAGSHPDPRRGPLSLRAFAAACGVEFRPEWEAELAEELASIAPLPGARAVMARLRRARLPLALASNLAAPYVPRVRELLGDLADVMLFSCEARLVKPEPEFFLSLCHQLGLPPGRVLMVEDSLASDILGARGIGMPAVQLWPAGGGEAGPGRIAKLEELPGMLGIDVGG